MDQAGVVADVGVGEEDAAEFTVWGMGLDQMKLFAKIGRGVDEPEGFGFPVDDAEGDDEFFLAGVGLGSGAVRAGAPGLGDAGVLGAAEEQDLNRHNDLS